MKKLCQCGCGDPVTKPANRFIHGHHLHTNSPLRVSALGKHWKLSEETKKRMSLAWRGVSKGVGRRFTEEHKKNLSRAHKLHIRSCSGTCGSPICARKLGIYNQITKIHVMLAHYLTEQGFDVVPEVSFGRYTVDLYEPDLHIAFEADGDYWHSLSANVERDLRRDKYLLERHNLAVYRFPEHEIHKLSIICGT